MFLTTVCRWGIEFLCVIDYTFQTSVNIGERLAITLFFLGKGDSIQTVAWGFRIGCSTAQEIVLETSKALYQVLAQDHLGVDTSVLLVRKNLEFAKLCRSD